MTDATRQQIDETVAGQTVNTLFEDATSEHGDEPFLKWKDGDDWKTLSWAGTRDRVRDVAKGFIALGLEPGEFVNLIGSNMLSSWGFLTGGGT